MLKASHQISENVILKAKFNQVSNLVHDNFWLNIAKFLLGNHKKIFFRLRNQRQDLHYCLV